MSIGIGGAGSKLASLLDDGRGTIVNVSGSELDKVVAANKIRAVVHSSRAQLRGSRKDPALAREAFLSVRDKLLELIQAETVFTSTGGGTGNGICSQLLEVLSREDYVDLIDKTCFGCILPYPEREAAEFVDNTIAFLEGPLSTAIDAGNTGNIFLFSNGVKFRKRIAEGKYNQMLIDSLRQFLAIPHKNDELTSLDGNIDFEDFALYQGKPYFNHFTQFEYNKDEPFEKQLKGAWNPLLLAPEGTIEAMFLLEVPQPKLTSTFYDILDYFAEDGVAPTYGVVHNPELEKPLITVSVLYSRKPLELVDDFNSISREHKRTRVKKSVDQYVTLTRLEVDLASEAESAAREAGTDDEEILSVLKRIGKL